MDPESYNMLSGFPADQNVLTGTSPTAGRSFVNEQSDHSPDDILKSFRKEESLEEMHKAEIRKKRSSVSPVPISNVAKKLIHSTIDTVIQHKHHKHCLGVLLLIHNDTAPPATTNFEILFGMGEGVEKLKIEFEKLGFAVVWLKNPTSAEVKAAVDYLSSEDVFRTFPESFKFFGVYVTCHGHDRTFFTKDGSMSYDSIASVAKKEHFRNELQLFLFIFDCCRSSPTTDVAAYPDGEVSKGEPSLPESNMGPNTMILYAQSGGGTTWGPGDGITYMAHDLLDLIGTDIYLVSLPTKLRERNNKRPLPSTMISPSHDTLCKEFILVKERDDKMAPRLKEPVVISADGAVAELHVNPRPSVNSAHFEHEEFDVQMRPGSTENWLSLKIYGETSRKYMSSSSSASSIGSSPSSSTYGKVILTAVLPVDHRTRVSNAEFRVISKMSGGLCLPSNVAEVALPEISQPKITKTIVCLKDCHPLELQTAWRLENKLSLQLSKFFVHVFKNGTEVHTTEISADRNKTEYSVTFFVPEVIKSETGDTYEVCVEAERELDKKRIPSIRVTAPKPERHFPSLKEVRISEDGATVTATVSFESVLDDETLNEQQYKLEMKVENEQEWKTLTNFQSSTLSEPVPINNGCQSPIALHESASFTPRQPATPDLCPPVARSTLTDSTDAHRMDLTALLPLDRKNCKVKFRVISERHNSLSIPSSSSPIKDLEEIAKPQVQKDGHIRFYNCRSPMATVKWKIQTPLSVQLSKFTVRIYGEDEEEALCFKDVPYKRDKVDYCFKIPITKLKVGRVTQYTVCVEATRTDNKVIRSDRVNLTTKRELCYNIWTRKCVCYVLMIVAAIFALIIGVALATILIIDINPHYLKSDIPWAPANLVSEIPKPPRDSLSSPFRTTDFTQESVERRKNDELTIYCAEIEIERLNNHQKVKYKLSFNEFNQNLTETTALLPLSLANPTAYYVLSQSKLSVYLCLSDREVHPLSVKLLLYKRVDQNSWEPENNVVVASQNVTFNSSSCTNTTVVAPESAVVYLALSSPDSVSFKSITGNVKQFYYDETALDIVNVSNIVSEEHSKIISGSSSKKLVCYVWGGFDDDSDIFYEIIFLRVPVVWKNWTPSVFILVCISLLFSLCVCIVFSCSFAARRRHVTHNYTLV